MKKKATIYIVDDDASARKGLTRLLLAAGCEVKSYVSSGDQNICDNIIDQSIAAECRDFQCVVVI